MNALAWMTPLPCSWFPGPGSGGEANWTADWLENLAVPEFLPGLARIPDPLTVTTRIMAAVHLPTFVALVAVGYLLSILGSPSGRQARGGTVHSMGFFFGTASLLGLLAVFLIDLSLGPPIRWPYKRIPQILMLLGGSVAQPFIFAPLIGLLRTLRRPGTGSFLAWIIGVLVMYSVAGYALILFVRGLQPAMP